MEVIHKQESITPISPFNTIINKASVINNMLDKYGNHIFHLIIYSRSLGSHFLLLLGTTAIASWSAVKDGIHQTLINQVCFIVRAGWCMPDLIPLEDCDALETSSFVTGEALFVRACVVRMGESVTLIINYER